MSDELLQARKDLLILAIKQKFIDTIQNYYIDKISNLGQMDIKALSNEFDYIKDNNDINPDDKRECEEMISIVMSIYNTNETKDE